MSKLCGINKRKPYKLYTLQKIISAIFANWQYFFLKCSCADNCPVRVKLFSWKFTFQTGTTNIGCPSLFAKVDSLDPNYDIQTSFEWFKTTRKLCGISQTNF